MNKETVMLGLVNNSIGMALPISEKDAEEIVALIEKQNKNIDEILNWWEACGTTWTEQEIIDYVSEGQENKISMDKILSWGTVFKLTSGLIVSWDY